MNPRRLQAAIGIGIFTVMVAVFSALPTHWHTTVVPKTETSPVQTVTFSCGSAWGPASVKVPASLPGPVVGRPCGNRTQLQVMGVADVGLGLAGMGFAIWWRPRDRRELAV